MPKGPSPPAGAADQRMRIGVIGAGFVGLVTAACLARVGHEVVVIERDAKRVAGLETGTVPFFEPGLEDVVAQARTAGRLRFATDAAALQESELCFIAVGTPPRHDGSSDVSMVMDAATTAAQHLPRDAVVAIRSTVPPGTNAAVQQALAPGRPDLAVVSTPEFLAEGTAVADFESPARLLFGGPEAAVERAVAAFAAISPDAPRIRTTWATAELVKYASNTFLAARVSLINEFARLCDAFGGDVRELAHVLGLDDRIGAGFLRAGIGYGGSCFPKDVQAITAAGRAAGVELDQMPAVEAANRRQWRYVLERAEAWVGGFSGQRVAVWGLAFKPGTDDVREAPALRVVDALLAAGAEVRVHDPKVRLDRPGILQCATPEEAAQGADLVLLVTEWSAYLERDWAAVAHAMGTPRIYDARNVLPGPALEAAGIQWRGIGRGPSGLPAPLGVAEGRPTEVGRSVP